MIPFCIHLSIIYLCIYLSIYLSIYVSIYLSILTCIHTYLFFFKIFLMWTIFKVFIEFVTILFLFYVLVFLAARHVGS